MIGLLFYGFLGVWFFLVYKISRFLVLNVKNVSVKPAAQVCIFILIFFAPVADEIIGGFQFHSLCGERAVITVDEEKARGKTVFSDPGKSPIAGYALPIIQLKFSYKDSVTNEILVSWNEYRAEGGWLVHLIGFSEKPPFVFNGYCYPKEAFEGQGIFKKLNIKQQDVK